MFVEVEVGEKGNEASVGLISVLLLLQPKWQDLVCIPIPILCSSLGVLKRQKGRRQ